MEEGLDKDFIRIEKHPFDENYSVKKIHTTEKGYTYTLLSVSGVLKTTSRSVKMKTILYWLYFKQLIE